jgi:DNA repair protein RadD
MNIELRPYQIDGLNALWNYFQSGKTGNPLLCWATGTGKSIAPAIFIKEVMRLWPTQRFMLITHVSELIKQNHEVLKDVWDTAPVGIHSAGLKQRDTAHPIIYAGIQSAVKRGASVFGRRDIVFIDEAHLISSNDTSMYSSFLAELKLINPFMKVIGMTATPYRMGSGMLTDDGGIFTDICHDITKMEEFNKLISDGYLSPLVPLRTRTELDVSNVSVNQGEFIATQLQGAVDKAEITFSALKEMCHAGADRKSWLIFASGIEHAEHIAEQLGAFGIDCAPVHSKRPSDYNDTAIKAFKANELRSIVNYGKLTTGFNHPGIDLIAMLRPTLSVPLWVQMLGRGTRIAPEKKDCLVLDFARNTPRLGPINDPRIPNKKGSSGGETPIKICESCGAYNHISARLCCNCGEAFTFQQKLVSKPGTEELIKAAATEALPQIETFNVLNATYAKHNGKAGKPPTLKATYFTTGLAFKEFVCLEHSGMAGKMARDWWRRRSKENPPASVDEALLHISNLKCPRFIRVHVNKTYPEILGVEF